MLGRPRMLSKLWSLIHSALLAPLVNNTSCCGPQDSSCESVLRSFQSQFRSALHEFCQTGIISSLYLPLHEWNDSTVKGYLHGWHSILQRVFLSNITLQLKASCRKPPTLNPTQHCPVQASTRLCEFYWGWDRNSFWSCLTGLSWRIRVITEGMCVHLDLNPVSEGRNLTTLFKFPGLQIPCLNNGT